MLITSRSHPHGLVGSMNSRSGVCAFHISEQDDMVLLLKNCGIQCVKKRDVENSFRVRSELGSDPFRREFHIKTLFIYC